MVNDMLLFAVGSVGRIARKIGDKNVRAIGLTSAQLRILFFLEEKDNVCQHDIENEFSMSRSAVSGMLDGMESDGLIVREKTDDDKRRRIICITDYGKSKLNAARKQIRIIIWNDCWTFWTSVVILVISDDVENLSISAKEKSIIFP